MPSFPISQAALAEQTLQGPAQPRSVAGVKAKACEFEAMLLSQWLQSAQTSLGSVPGGDEDEDPEAQQWMGFAAQQLAKAVSERGGIGIGKLVEKALLPTQEPSSAPSQRTNDTFLSR